MAIPYIDLGWFLFLLVILFWLSFEMKREAGGLAGIFVAFLLLRTAMVFAEYGGPVEANVDRCAAMFLIFYFVLWALSGWSWLGFCLPYLIGFNALLVLAQRAMGLPGMGIVGNPSMNGTFLAMGFPLCFGFFSNRVTWIVVAAIFLTGESIPIGTLAVVSAAYFIARGPRAWLLAPGIVALLFGIGLAFVPDFLSSTGRFHLWAMILPNWFATMRPYTIAIGSGGGTFAAFGEVFHPEGSPHLMEFLHSDWLQLFLEFGTIGLVFGLALFVQKLRDSYSDPARFAAIAGLASAAIFNWPAHCAWTSLLAFHLLRSKKS